MWHVANTARPRARRRPAGRTHTVGTKGTCGTQAGMARPPGRRRQSGSSHSTAAGCAPVAVPCPSLCKYPTMPCTAALRPSVRSFSIAACVSCQQATVQDLGWRVASLNIIGLCHGLTARSASHGARLLPSARPTHGRCPKQISHAWPTHASTPAHGSPTPYPTFGHQSATWAAHALNPAPHPT